ncbi:hypothetical protein CEXT_522031 [Caerostris extrusa]|uniref:Uncharacterized protein n=1 Tax=Caerostris extrusa TaxID=172846 RepID=A0AAV4PNF1_CAEEX|nr:hypothetical protein CEXT_522031 [Caerostris extrusa]
MLTKTPKSLLHLERHEVHWQQITINIVFMAEIKSILYIRLEQMSLKERKELRKAYVQHWTSDTGYLAPHEILYIFIESIIWKSRLSASTEKDVCAELRCFESRDFFHPLYRPINLPNDRSSYQHEVSVIHETLNRKNHKLFVPLSQKVEIRNSHMTPAGPLKLEPPNSSLNTMVSPGAELNLLKASHCHSGPAHKDMEII